MVIDNHTFLISLLNAGIDRGCTGWAENRSGWRRPVTVNCIAINWFHLASRPLNRAEPSDAYNVYLTQSRFHQVQWWRASLRRRYVARRSTSAPDTTLATRSMSQATSPSALQIPVHRRQRALTQPGRHASVRRQDCVIETSGRPATTRRNQTSINSTLTLSSKSP